MSGVLLSTFVRHQPSSLSDLSLSSSHLMHFDSNLSHLSYLGGTLSNDNFLRLVLKINSNATISFSTVSASSAAIKANSAPTARCSLLRNSSLSHVSTYCRRSTDRLTFFSRSLQLQLLTDSTAALQASLSLDFTLSLASTVAFE